MHTFRFQLVKRLVASKNFMEYNPITVYIAFLSFCGLSAFVIPCLQQFRGSPEEIFGKKNVEFDTKTVNLSLYERQRYQNEFEMTIVNLKGNTADRYGGKDL